MKRNNLYPPSVEDMIEMGGFEILHPGGSALTHRTGEVLQLQPGMHILDVSSGRGTQSIYYAQKFGVTVTGLDLSHDMINSARENAKREEVSHLVDFVHGDSQDLPFEDNTFDAVINECAVGIPDDSQKVLDEMSRVTKPGGKIAIHESIWLQKLSQTYRDEFSERYGTTPLYLEEWLAMLEKAKIKEVEYEKERWSQPHQFWSTRKDRTPKNHKDIATFSERVHVTGLVFKRYGFKGLFHGLKNEQLFWKGILNGHMGYSLFWGEAE